MLDLDTATEVLGVTTFQDRDNPTNFAYLPTNPRISRDSGGPMFDLYVYRKGGVAGATRAGGFLTLTVDCGLGALHDAVAAKLSSRVGAPVTLSSVHFSSGTVRLIALDESATSAPDLPGVAAGPRFVQQVIGSGTPSLDGENRAIFSLSLSEDGAALFLGALAGHANSRPLGVVYELTYVGLQRAYDVDITIDTKSSYSFLENRFAAGCVFFKADIDSITEQLKADNHITISERAALVEANTPDAIAARTKALNELVTSLAAGALFQPTLVPGLPKAAGNAPATILSGAPATSPPGAGSTPTPVPSTTTTAPVKATPPTPTPTPTPATVTPATSPAAGQRHDPPPPAEDPPASPQTPASSPTPPTPTPPTPPPTPPVAAKPPATPIPTPVTPAPTPATTAATTTPAPIPTPALGAAANDKPSGATKLWDDLGRPQAAFTMRSISQDERKTISYSLNQIGAVTQKATPQGMLQMMCSPEELAARVHVIDLNHPFFSRVKIRIDCPDVDFTAEGVSEMAVEVRYGLRPDGTGPKDTGSAILRASTDSVDLEFFVDHRGDLGYEYRIIVDYRAQFGVGVRSTRVEGPWTRSEARTLSVHPRWLALMVPVGLELAPNTPEDVTEVRVAVRYQRADVGVDDGTVVSLTRASRSATVNLRLAAPGDPVTFTPTVFYADGASETLQPHVLPNSVAQDALSIAIPKAGRLDGDVMLVDALGEVAKVVVDLEVSQADSVVESRSIEVAGSATRVPWSVRLPSRDKPAGLRWRQRVAYADGGLEQEDWTASSSTALVVGMPSEGVLAVQVRYVGPPPSGLGLAGVIVELTYADPGGDPAFAQNESLFFDDLSAATPQEWRVRLKDRAARTYQWSVTTVATDGTQSGTTASAATQDQLFIRPPISAAPIPAAPGPTPEPPPTPQPSPLAPMPSPPDQP